MRFMLAAMMAISTIAAPVRAAEIVQLLSATEYGIDQGPFSIFGADFDTKLGTLRSVTARLFGSYQAHIYVPEIAYLTSPVPSTVRYSFDGFGPGNSFTGDLGSLLLTVSGSYLISRSFQIDLTFHLPSLQIFEVDQINPDYLASFGIYSYISGGGLGASSDSSTFNGNLALTYTYDVSEPGSILIFACALFLAATARRFQKCG